MTNLIKYDNMDSIIEELSPFIAKSYQSIQVSEHDAIFFLNTMRQGLLKVGEIYAQASYQESQAKLRKERIEARLRLEEFPEFARMKNILKPTEKDKEAFIVMQEEYEEAYNEERKWVAISKYLETVRSSLYTTIDDVKKNVYSKTHYNNLQIRG